jgi:crotonobetainyl-CoA:carnitine CoA-transferase CaiB-like acyl-CoA transferase
MTAPPLARLRVLDFTGDLGALCGKILSDLGADVVRVEPPGGSALRHRGARAHGVVAPEAGLAWWADAGGARSLVLDLDTPGGQRRARDMARSADIVVESFAPGYLQHRGLGWETLHRDNPRAILTSITPFGQDGPYRAWKGPEIVVQALSGMMHLIGDADRPPVRVGGDQASLQAAGQAVVGTLLAHLEREVTGQGQWIDVSAQGAMLWTMLSESALPPLHGWTPGRDGVYTRAGRFRRRLIFPCRDGFVAMIVAGGALGAATMEALTAWMAEEGAAPDVMRARDWKAWDAAHLLALGERAQPEIDEVVDAVAAFVARKTKAELYAAALGRSLLLAPLMDAADLARDEQLAARGFFEPAPEPRLGRAVMHCGPFARLSATPLAAPRPAPRLGEGGEDAAREWAAPRVPTGTGAPRLLRGLRVIDFAWVVTGPITGRLFAEFGADVIRVESARRLDPGRTLQPWAGGKAGLNRSQMFANANAGKRSVTLDLARPEARDLARRLVAGADVVIESFTPGTMGRWGLDYASVRALRPDIVYLSTCQQGQTGPHASYRGYGSLAAALAGFYTVTGWPDRDPSIVYGAYTDFVAHHFASAAVLAALDHRARTGEGQHIDVSQRETGLHFLIPEILEYTVNGRAAGRRGNAVDHAAPHNAYPCAGQDRWCAIACETDAEWRALAGLIGDPDWSRDPRYASLAGRTRHEADLDRHIAAWTFTQEAHALVERLQNEGVPAGVAQSCADLHRDPQIAARPGLVWLEHPEMGRTPYEAWGFRFAGRASELRRAPCLGEHTDAVLRDVLELTSEEIADLRAAGVLA